MSDTSPCLRPGPSALPRSPHPRSPSAAVARAVPAAGGLRPRRRCFGGMGPCCSAGPAVAHGGSGSCAELGGRSGSVGRVVWDGGGRGRYPLRGDAGGSWRRCGVSREHSWQGLQAKTSKWHISPHFAGRDQPRQLWLLSPPAKTVMEGDAVTADLMRLGRYRRNLFRACSSQCLLGCRKCSRYLWAKACCLLKPSSSRHGAVGRRLLLC